MMAPPTDENLLRALVENDESALRVLVDRYACAIYRFALRFSNDERLSEDISQEVFLRVYRHARQFDPRWAFKTWLFTIARNVCIDMVKSARVRQFESLDTVHSDASGTGRQSMPSLLYMTPEDQMIVKENELALGRALRGLPENQRTSIVLRYLEAMAVKEIAAVMDCSVSAVESLLVRAKHNLAKSLLS